MNTISTPTRHLVELLEDALETAGDDPEVTHMHSVLLFTDRGDWTIANETRGDDEPLFDEVTSDLLVATSLNGNSVGQGHAICDGQLRAPVLISVPSAKSVIKVMKPLITKSGLPKTVTHRCTLYIDPASPRVMEISEDQDLVEDGTSVIVPLIEIEDYYPRGIALMLTPDPEAVVIHEGSEVPPSYGTGLLQSHLEAISKVAKRHKMTVGFYRHHQKRRIVAEVGKRWRGVFLPIPMDTPELEQAPGVQVFDPDLPAVSDVGEQRTEQQLPV